MRAEIYSHWIVLWLLTWVMWRSRGELGRGYRMVLASIMVAYGVAAVVLWMLHLSAPLGVVASLPSLVAGAVLLLTDLRRTG